LSLYRNLAKLIVTAPPLITPSAFSQAHRSLTGKPPPRFWFVVMNLTAKPFLRKCRFAICAIETTEEFPIVRCNADPIVIRFLDLDVLC
jgi:hypothetical protein